MVKQGLEMQILDSWEGWDEVDIFILQFSGVVVKPEIQEKVGFDVSFVVVDGNSSKVQFYGEGDEFKEFSLKVTVE